MKRMLLFVLLFSTAELIAQNPMYTVNAIIGDKSFVQTFGGQPNESTNEVLRIQTHLLLAENKLRNETPRGLTKKQKRKRENALDLLHKYAAKGIFPSNYDFPEERKPCFIDRDGKICAVGYLIEKTTGIEVAEQINSLHQYDYIMDMNEEMVTGWARKNGLTLEECAMIQPTYGGIPTDETIEAAVEKPYGISSGIIGGTNIGINIFNLTNRGAVGFKIASKIGLVSGTAQLVLGLANIRRDRVDYMVNGYSTRTSYKAQNNLSYINIAAGTATLISSAFNLYLNKNTKKEEKNSFSLYSYPDTNQQFNLGLSLVRRL